MKIVIFTVDHIYANKVIKDLVAAFGSEIKLIAESETLLPKKSKLQALRKYLKISGFYYVFTQMIKLEIYKCLSILTTAFSFKNSKFYSYRPTVKKFKTKLTTIKDVNEQEFIRKLNNINPDLIISVYFNQIISEEVIDIPKKGIVNIHPAYLPDYKGISPVFWSLANSEKYAGVTVHYIDKGVDTGNIIEREKIKIEKDDTEDSLYWRICEIGSPLLIRAVDKIRAGRVQLVENKGGRYFSLPTEDAVRKYRKSRAFFNLKDYIFG